MADRSPDSSRNLPANNAKDLIEKIRHAASDSDSSTEDVQKVMNEAEALLFVPGYFVLGRSDINTNPICLDQVKDNQWDATKVFSPIYGHTADIVEDVVYGKVELMSVLLWQKYRVQIKLFEYHGIRDSRLVSKRQATPYLIVHLEKRKYRGDPIVGFITPTVREFLVESNLHEVHCLVMEDECWDHAGDGYNNTDADEDMIDEM